MHDFSDTVKSESLQHAVRIKNYTLRIHVRVYTLRSLLFVGIKLVPANNSDLKVQGVYAWNSLVPRPRGRREDVFSPPTRPGNEANAWN